MKSREVGRGQDWDRINQGWFPTLADLEEYRLDGVWVWSSIYFTAGPRLKPGRYENIQDIAGLPGLTLVKYHPSLKLQGVGSFSKAGGKGSN